MKIIPVSQNLIQQNTLKNNKSVSNPQTRPQGFVLSSYVITDSITNVAFHGDRRFIKAAKEGNLDYIIQKINSTTEDRLADLLNGKNFF